MITLQLNNGTLFSITGLANTSFTRSMTTTLSADLSSAAGISGLDNLAFSYSEPQGIDTFNFQISLAYEYTPSVPPAAVSATPEPSSFVLLGTGVLSVAGMLRRRFAY